MLLAIHLQKIDRTADVLISAFEDNLAESASVAAKARVLQAREGGLRTNAPREISVREHKMYRLRIASDAIEPGDESSYYFSSHGFVVHIAVFTHEPTLAASIESAIEHLEFLESEQPACTVDAPVAIAGANSPTPSSPPRLYYGPALPTDLVDAAVRQSPSRSIPDGHFSQGVFVSPELGLRAGIPPGWKPLPTEESFRVTELMRDPTEDPENSDRRRALFRACTRMVFAASDPSSELIPEVHPAFAIAAMPQGCVPDLVMPTTFSDRAASEEFATLLARSLGLTLLSRGSIHANAPDDLTFKLDGALPYKSPGEMLSRRLSLRVSARNSGQWLIFVYSVAPSSAVQKDFESRISIGTPRSTETSPVTSGK
jgi:hypothetical protein